jgi:hypothetical protein
MMLGDIMRIVWLVFGNDRLTTKDIENRLETMFSYKCPDDFAKTLMKLKQGGFVKGEVSMEHGGWVWWVDDECRSSDLSKIM